MEKTLLGLLTILLTGIPSSAQDTPESAKPKLIDTESSAPGTSDISPKTDMLATEKLSDEVIAALKTSPDAYGIPSGIYQHDRMLSEFRDMVKGGESSTVLFGSLGGVLVGLGIVLAIAAPNFVWAPSYVPTSIPYGYFIAGVGGSLIMFDLIFIVPRVPKNKAQLIKTYETKYGNYDK